MAKVSKPTASSWQPKPKRKLRRHTKHINKHKSKKPSVGQG